LTSITVELAPFLTGRSCSCSWSRNGGRCSRGMWFHSVFTVVSV